MFLLIVRLCGFWAPANLVFKALHPLMAAMVQMCALGEESFVAAAGWDGGSVLCQGMAELLAGDAHHGRPAWAQRRRGDRAPVRLLRRCCHAVGLTSLVLMY